MARPTMADVARETGLTLGTVSRALNKDGKYAIAPETRDRVWATATRLGYRPNLIGRALASGSATLVLLITPDPFAPYYVEISRHLSARAARHGYSFVTGGALRAPETEPGTRAQGEAEGETDIAPSDWLYGVDGIVVCDCLPHQEAYVREALRLKIPVVALGVRYPFPGDRVRVEIGAASRRLMRHLLDQGCAHPAMLASPGASPDDPRHVAYRETLAEAGIPPRFLLARDQSRASARAAIQEQFGGGAPIDGLFCENDVLAVGAYRGLTDLGVRVPEDVRLAGCDGLDDALYQRTPITTISQPLERMCDLGWTMLQARMEGSTEPAHAAEVVAELQIRASTGP